MAMILDAFINRFTDQVINLIDNKLSTLLGVDLEVQRLRSTLKTITTVLHDAEAKRAHNRLIDSWLCNLKDAMYDADDILDLFFIAADKYSSQTTTCLIPSCFRNPALAYRIGSRIKSLNVKLDQISKEKDSYGLLHLQDTFRDINSEISDKTSSLVESDLVGTDIVEDTQKLVGLLTRQDTRENVLVFAIVGMGGIGKTTRAQLIYDDEIVKGYFHLRFWVSVSANFDENDLLRDVISSVHGDCGGASSRSQLEVKLVEIIKGKKFLVVIDDVWVESVWDKLLRNPFSRGAVGSRVLVTTRSELIAKQMKAIYCHQVEVLPPEDGWSLLCKKLILSGEEGEINDLKDIGLKIVEKCGGLPLAIKAMGAVLCSKSRRDWKAVLRSTAWSVSGLPDQVNKALYLSYLHLPSHLMQCFLYCFLLPKSHTIDKAELVQLWIAEGFVKDPEELDTSMEETGELYCRELIWRNLLQSDAKSFHLAYKMHDVIRPLAGFLAQEESLLVDSHLGLSNKSKSSKLCRLSIVGGEMQLDFLRSKESLRTLFLFNTQFKNLNYVTHHFPFLRVLQVCGSKIQKLPDSITSLSHLRYLRVHDKTITKLPKAIGNLRNLQFLILSGCHKLECLPPSIVALKNLRALDINSTAIKGMPAGIGSLHHLRSLLGYSLHSLGGEEGPGVTVASRWSTLKDLGPLLQLRQLFIVKLEKAFHISEAISAALMVKCHLIHVALSCTSGWMDDATDTDIKRIEEVFNVLQPPPCLEVLQIKGFPGSRFPNWMITTVFSNLRLLFLYECKYCEILPPLGQLPNLVHLSLYYLPTVSSIGPEFMGPFVNGEEGKKKHSSTSIAFPKLENLVFNDMPSWENWQWERELHAMPHLQSLHLQCPKLISLPVGISHHATTLTEMTITDAENLKSVGNIDSLRNLEAVDSSGMEEVCNLPALRILSIRHCPSLEKVEGLHSLQSIVLVDFKMDSLPEWLHEDRLSRKPETLDIYCNQQVFEKICRKKVEEWHKIQHINHVEVYCEDDKARASYTRDPFSFTTTFSGSTSNITC